ncbi:MAG TPA: NADH-quinone oxidoreductase subunit B family protein [Ktedonobacteraceae bacterium]|nr:NADH-quinone oxidoreductase subunit B family protein [Ktedonobacteraceae bacterium]
MEDPLDEATREAAARLNERVQRLFGHSLHIRHVDAGSCNACESEIKLLLNPYYDVQRLGIFFTTSPRHADLLLVTGPVTRAMEDPLRQTYDAMPDPRLVVAVGACACSGGIFGASAFARAGVAEVLPVDVFIPGCPPSPLTLIHGLLLALGRAEQRVHGRVQRVREDRLLQMFSLGAGGTREKERG